MKYLLTLIISFYLILGYSQSEAVVSKTNSGKTNLSFTENGDNTLIGINAGSQIGQGVNNVLLGNYTGLGLTNGNNNTLVGLGAGNIASGSGNVAIGYNAGQLSTGSNNVFLGQLAGASSSTATNSLWIENSSGDSTQALIYGQFDNDLLRFNAQTNIYSNAMSDEGLYVEKNHAGNSDFPAIYGVNDQTDYYGIGVKGRAGWIGLQGEGIGVGGGFYYGVVGSSIGTNGGRNTGIYGEATNGGTNYAIHGEVLPGSNNFAGYFDGKVRVTDTLILSNNGIQIEPTKVVKKATSMKYYIATEGTFPSSGGSNTGTLIGEIKLLPYISTVPGGWLECDGSEIPIASNTALFALIGTTYGGNGQTTFAVPDMREAVPYHAP